MFSQSRVMLDILQRACRARRFRCLRLDGSVASSADRAVRAPASAPSPPYLASVAIHHAPRADFATSTCSPPRIRPLLRTS